MGFAVTGTVSCDVRGCTNTHGGVPAVIKGSIEAGGSVRIELIEELPPGWRHNIDYGSVFGYSCPTCSAEMDERRARRG